MKGMNGAARRALSAAREFTIAQRTIALIGVAVLVLGGIALASWLGKPSYSPLFTGLSASDASAVVAQLQKDKVDYQLSDGGATILVPAGSVDAERLSAASAGLPSSSTQGYALLDTLGVTASEFQQNVTYKRAIEGEIAKTIESIQGVTNASVQLAIPQQTVYTQSQQATTASVFVNATQSLTTDQVQAIVHLTAASVPGLSESNVSVVDAKGDVLSSVGGATTGGSNTEEDSTYEARVRTAVQTMLDSVLGPGNSTVTVAADISDSTGTQTSTTYTTPTGAPTTSESSNISKYGSATGTTDVTGVLGNSTDGLTTGTSTGTGTGTGSGNYISAQGVKNNALNKTTTTASIPSGQLKRQTIAVAINSDKVTKVSAATVQSLVSAAAGVDPTRGDIVTVAPVSFSTAAAASAKAALAQAAQSQQADNMTQLITTGIYVAGGLAALVFLFIVLRKLFKKPEVDASLDGGEMTVLPGSMSDLAPGIPAQLGGASQYGDHGMPPAPSPAAATARYQQAASTAPTAVLDTENSFAQLQADVDALAGADPEKTAEYLKALMGSGANA